MDTPKPFSQYYAEAQAKRKAGAPSVRPAISPAVSGSGITPAALEAMKASHQQKSSAENPVFNFMSSFIDILSRPLFGTTNAVSKSFDTMSTAKDAEAKRNAGDPWGAVGDVLGAQFKQSVSPVTGWLSTSPDDKIYGADLIEKGTDTFGKVYNEANYSDVQDNVHPGWKGAGGLAIDIFADPLTYTPAAAFKAAGRGIAKTWAPLKAKKAESADRLAKGELNKIGDDATAASTESVFPENRYAGPAPVNDVAPLVDDFTDAFHAAPPTPATAPKPMGQLEMLKPAAPPAKADLSGVPRLYKGAAGTSQVRKVVKEIEKDPKRYEGVGTSFQKWLDGRAVTTVGKLGTEAAKQAKDYRSASKYLNETLSAKGVVAAEKAGKQAAKESNKVTAPKTMSDAPLDPPKASEFLGQQETVTAMDAARKTTQAKNVAVGLNQVEKIMQKAGQGMEGTPPLEFIGTKNVGGKDVPTSPWMEEYIKELRGMKKRTPQQQNNLDVMERLLTEDTATFSPVQRETSLKTWAAVENSYEQYLKAHTRYAQNGEILSPAGVRSKMGSEDPSIAMAKAMDMIDNHRMTEVSELRNLLGDDLLDGILRIKNPQNLPGVVAKLKGILAEGYDVSRMSPTRDFDTATEALFRQVGVDPDLITKGYRPPTSTQILRETSSTQAEFMAKLVGTDPATNNLRSAIQALKLDPATPIAQIHAQLGLNSTVFRNFIQRFKSHPHETKFNHRRSSTTPGKGTAIRKNEWNSFTQADALKQIKTGIRNSLGKHNIGLGGAKMAREMMEQTMPALDLMERAVAELGIQATTGLDNARHLISNFDILSTLNKADPDTAAMALWNFDTMVPETVLSDAIVKALRDGSIDDIALALSATTVKGGGALPNNLARGGKFGKGNVVGGEQAVGALARLIHNSVPTLKEIEKANRAALRQRIGAETVNMTSTEVELLESIFKSEAGFGPILAAINSSPTRVATIAKELGTTPEALKITNEVVEASIPTVDREIAKAAVKAEDTAVVSSKKISDGTARLDGKKITTGRQAADFIQEAGIKTQLDKTKAVMNSEELLDNVPIMERNFDMKIHQGINEDFLSRTVAPIFSRGVGMSTRTHSILKEGESLLRSTSAGFHGKLRVLSRTGEGKPTLAKAFHAIQKGYAHADPAVMKVQKELEDLVGQIFNVKEPTALVNNVFLRENSNFNHVNGILEYVGKFNKSVQPFKLDVALKASKEQNIPFAQAISEQWRTWDIEDPANFLIGMHGAFLQTQAHQSIASTFMKMSHDLGVVSAVSKPGYARIGGGSSSILAKYLPRDVFIDDSVLRQFHVVDQLIQKSLNTGDLNNFVKNVYRPLLDIWKVGMTILNPTHHIRNGISDASLSYLQQGMKNSVPSYKDATAILATRNKYTGWDAQRMLSGDRSMVSGKKVLYSGKLGSMTAESSFVAGKQRGVYPDFKVLENLEEKAGGKLGKMQNDFMQTRTMQGIGAGSEYLSHYFRASHFSQIMRNNIDNTRKFRTLDDLIEYAALTSRRWHPDGSDLTTAEQGFRLAIPFYSWQRRVIPLITEAALSRPARVMVFPKAQYNLAISMGVNPDSLMDPFPDDQLFPEYLTGQMTGPNFVNKEGEYFGWNPGFAPTDTLNEYMGKNPFKAIMGSLAPALKMPAEMATGSQMGTGAQINDYSDYIDSNFPIISPLARTSGYSVTGSAVGMLSGRGLDQQYQVERGNKDPKISLLNWLTGAGVRPMSQPNQVKMGEIQERNRMSDNRATF